MTLKEYLSKTFEMGGSDMFIVPGSPVMTKVDGAIKQIGPDRLMPNDTADLIRQTYELAGGRTETILKENGDDDFSFSLEHQARYRCNVYRQRNSFAATYRVVSFGLPDYRQRNIPDMVMQLAESNRSGMILVTGPAGSGKSTTLACMIDRINSTRSGHIITIEDPIEYLHSHKKSLVSQREVPTDAITFERALRGALRQAPDAIMLGEMRDHETMQIAITAAETGHLMLSSLHTVGAAKTVDRIVDAFPPEQQQQVRIQLSMVLKAVISQRLIPTLQGGLVPVFEVMTITPAVQNMIRDGKTHQIDNVIVGATVGQSMMSMDNELFRLAKAGIISKDNACLYATNTEMMRKRLGV